MASNPDSRPLPDGWITQLNTEYNTWFYVNTKAPGGPQSQWTHPVDDKPPAGEFASPSGPPPAKNEKATYNAEKSEYAQAQQQPYDQQQFAQQQSYQQGPPPQQQQKRGFLSKLTGKASGQQQGYPGGYGGGYGAPPPPGYAQPMGYGQQPMYGGYPQQPMYGQQPMMMQGGRRPGGGLGGGLALGMGGGLLGGMMLGNAMADHDGSYADGYADGAGGDGELERHEHSGEGANI